MQQNHHKFSDKMPPYKIGGIFMIKKTIFTLTLVPLLFLLSCTSQPQYSDYSTPAVRIAALRGPTAMGLLHLMDYSEQNLTTNNYIFSLLGSPMEVPPLLVRGDVDVAVVPANLAAVLYNQMEGAVQALAVVTLGVLHIVDTTGEIQTIADLAGRTIFVSGQGATPEFALNYVLIQNG